MIFSILIIILVAVIAFFHYTQGFFSAAISALLAIISAVIALSYQEVIVNNWLKGKFADEANAIVLIVTFAVCYIILRFIFDAVIPGNIRLPLLVEKVGAGVMGVIAGLCVGGTVAIAAQMLPFGPTIAGYARFQTTDSRHVILRTPGFGQAQDMEIHDELKNDKFDPAAQQGMILPCDDWLVEFVSFLSQPTGSLSGDRTVQSVHPKWLDQLFADRLGIQTGAKHVAFNLPGEKQVQVTGVFAPESLPEIGGESTDIRPQPSGVVKSNGQDVLLVIRVMFGRDATDSDNIFRFSMGSSQLIADGHVYYGIGTVAHGETLLASRLDDFLFIPITGPDQGADIAFMVPRSEVLAAGKSGAPAHIAPNVFIQIKRLARIDLGGKEVAQTIPPNPNVVLLRKPDVEAKIKAPVKSVAAPLSFQTVKTSDQLFTSISAGTPDATVKDRQLESGTISMTDHKFSKMKIDPTNTIEKMAREGYQVQTLYAPPGKTIVQIDGQPSGDNPWAWADVIGQFTLVDTDGHRYEPSGVVAKLKDPNGLDRMFADYNAAGTVSSLSAVEGRPTDVWVIYQVPAGTKLKQWDFSGKLTHDLSGQ